jgi:hypothetical protein
VWWPLRRKLRLEPPADSSRFREVTIDRRQDFLRAGFHDRHFFPHRIYYVPRRGPDGHQLAESMYGVSDPARLKQVLIFAAGPGLEGLPADLFFDDDLVWHRQQLGLPGHVAGANLIARGRDLLTTARYSDIVQRISRRREFATRVEKRFRGWDRMLLNAILNYAVERHYRRVWFPTAELAMANTDPKRTVQRDMFERIYDTNVRECLRVERRGRFWVADVNGNRDRLVRPAAREERLSRERTICICHDIERELGHVGIDPEFAAHAADTATDNLHRMLEIEARRTVRSTYDVVGCILGEVQGAIARGSHEIAFHSYDHRPHLDQLRRCRRVDYRIRGYRPPNSRVTAELSDATLSRHNFEWLASSPETLGTVAPALGNGIVRVPIFFDDFPMYKRGTPFEEWERNALTTTGQRSFTAFGLHDCYASHWLERYDALLAKLSEAGTIRTVGEVADRIFLGTAE